MDGQSDAKRFNVLKQLFGKKVKSEISQEAILELIDEGKKQGVINQTSKEMIEGIFEFRGKAANEIMTSRVEVEAIDATLPIEETMERVLETQFSRLPVYEGDLHHIIGILHVQDFLCQVHKVGLNQIDLKTVMIKPYVVPETKNVQKLFKELQRTQNHIAILRDEYGDFVGIITIEDILEEIVGDIRDEHECDQTIAYMEDGSYLVDGLTHIDDINRQLNLGIECDHFDTIGGFVINLIGSIPKASQQITVEYKELIFEVKKVKANRVEKLLIYRRTDIAV